ncbi:hypothetical protein GEO21_20685 [Sphingobacterium faecium]|uniref:hypothetical protein n=1 Tax=Sphingobacterium faecium TaxID=34087 RepID=UPI0012920C12|nr:hypothetical protein [Sphingobacterium faecium]MQP29908.1 hypothetical protein [Sphingobacterium faecium]
MKKIILFLSWILTLPAVYAQNSNDYLETSVTFPSNFIKGDYIEFASSKYHSPSANATGYYEISISYSRGNIAAAATHIASSTHSNSNRWQEAGRINNNIYTVQGFNFTVDHNPGTKGFRIRAVNNLGISAPLIVNIKIRSINFSNGFNSVLHSGNEPNLVPLLPMTYDWDLIVGNNYSTAEGILAIKATSNGNVGIGTPTPSEKLAVNGKIRAQEIRVDAGPWPDYVFQEGYALTPLDSLEQFVKTNKHLPNISSAFQVEKEGVELGELNKQLLQKVEELTLYLIDQHKEIRNLKAEMKALKDGK